MKDGTSKTLVCKYVMQITYNIYVCLWILVLRSLCVEDCKDEGTKRAGHVDSSALDCYQDSVVVWFVCVKCSEFTWASREWTTATHMGPYIIICTQQEAAQGDVCCNWQSGLRGETGEHKGLYDTYLRRIYGFVLDWYITVIWNSSRYECRFIYIYIIIYLYIYIYMSVCICKAQWCLDVPCMISLNIQGTMVPWCTKYHADREQVDPPLSWGATSTNGPAWRSSRQLNKRSPPWQRKQ